MIIVGAPIRCGAEYAWDAKARRCRVRCDCGARTETTFATLDDATASWVGHRNARAAEQRPAS